MDNRLLYGIHSGDFVVDEDVQRDDFFLSLLSEEIQDDQINVITEGLQLQKAIYSSSCMIIDSDGTDNGNSVAEKIFPGFALHPDHESPPEEEMDRPNNSRWVCELCTVQEKRENAMIRVCDCGHYFCEYCLNKYISAKVDNGERSIKCPAEICCNFIQYDYCVATMLNYVLDKRGHLFSESLILDSKTIPCPYKDCESGLLKENLEGLREMECPACRRFLCVRCYVPWHAGVECEDFQRISKGERGWKDLLIMEELARVTKAD